MLTRAQQYIEDRIERIPESGCWIWMQHLAGADYGRGFFNDRETYAHRLAWEAYRGPIKKFLLVLHHCDVTMCCNPAHLFLGTDDDNSKDMVRKNRQARGETHPAAKLTEQHVREIRIPTSEPLRVTAHRYGVCRMLISLIRRRKIWTHLD